MDFISNEEAQNREMLKVIGVENVEDLFQVIPNHLKLSRPQQKDGLSEYEGMKLIEALSEKNHFQRLENYLGAGAYEHHIPALVEAICSKSEFLTSYTSYQPEVSQGILQAIFEFQSVICALTGMDVANASVYDASSACAEALLMALRHHKDRKKVVIGHSVHPHYRGVIAQYLKSHQIEIDEVPFLKDGTMDSKLFREKVDDKTAAVLVQYPNFFGVIDNLKDLGAYAKNHGALFIICGNPLTYGIYASAKELGADIAVGDCQPFGIALQFGGPYAGYMTCREALVRQLPGRIVGETKDSKGRRGFVLTLQAREQHIRREKATSNLCTNQTSTALAALIAILWYGKKGLPKLALMNYQKAAYLKHELEKISWLMSMGQAPFFNEFAIKFPRLEIAQKAFRHAGIEPGLDLGRYYPSLKGYLLVAVTETKTKTQLDRYVEVAKKLEANETLARG